MHVTCFFIESDGCVDGSVRLRNGSISQEGRVEVVLMVFGVPYVALVGIRMMLQ